MKRILSMIATLVMLLSFGLVNTLYSKGNTLVVGGEAADRDKLPHIWWNAGAQDYYMSSLLFTDENQNPGKNDSKISYKTKPKHITKKHQKIIKKRAKMLPGISWIFLETVPGATRKRKDPLKRH